MVKWEVEKVCIAPEWNSKRKKLSYKSAADVSYYRLLVPSKAWLANYVTFHDQISKHFPIGHSKIY